MNQLFFTDAGKWEALIIRRKVIEQDRPCEKQGAHHAMQIGDKTRVQLIETI